MSADHQHDCLPPKIAAHSPSNGDRAPGLASIVMPLRVADSRADEIAVISHELRNSLGVVRNAARLLRLPVDENGVEARACSSSVTSAR